MRHTTTTTAAQTLKIIVSVIFLLITVPDEIGLNEILKMPTKNSFSSIASYFGFSLKRLVSNEASLYYYLIRLYSSQRNIYYIGVAGYWIIPEFWLSIPGSFLLSNLIMNLVFSPNETINCWLEITIASLFFCYFGMQFFLKYMDDSQFMSIFMFLSYLISYVIVTYVLYPLNLFQRRISPGSLIYGVACCCLSFMAHTETTLKWNNLTMQWNQLVIALVLVQLLLGHGVGFAGTLSGFVILYLIQLELLPL